MGQGRFRTALATVAVGLVVAGCSSSNGGGATPTGSASTSEPIDIGISLSLSGDFSDPGNAAKKGYELWADQVNANGGILGRRVR